MLVTSTELQIEECGEFAGSAAPERKAVRACQDRVRAGTRLLRDGETLWLEPAQDLVQLVVPVGASVEVGSVREADRLDPGQALVLAQASRALLSARASTHLLLIDVPRGELQARCFAVSGEPRRVGRANLVLPCDDVRQRFGEAILSLSAINIFRFRDGGQARVCVGDAIVGALAGEMRDHEQADELFPIAASVQRAVERMRAVGAEPVTDDEVVRAAGVTRLTLRRTIRDVTGVPFVKLMADARLDWVRSRLQSNQESRSLSALAQVLGYNPVAFSRTYQRRFGETPTQTRTRAFKTVR